MIRRWAWCLLLCAACGGAEGMGQAPSPSSTCDVDPCSVPADDAGHFLACRTAPDGGDTHVRDYDSCSCSCADLAR